MSEEGMVYDPSIVLTISATRYISIVPALAVCSLVAEGLLPELPEHVVAMEQFGKRRSATLEEVAAVTWLVVWEGAKPVGVAAYRDVFDYPSGSDVREIVHITGSKRAVVLLLRGLRRSAREQGRRLIGSIDHRNEAMAHLFDRMGFSSTRVIYEDPEN